MKNKLIKSGLLLLMWLVYGLPVLAGPVDPPGGEDPPYIDPTPINQWEFMLIFAAIAVAAYFVMKYQRKAVV